MKLYQAKVTVVANWNDAGCDAALELIGERVLLFQESLAAALRKKFPKDGWSVDIVEG